MIRFAPRTRARRRCRRRRRSPPTETARSSYGPAAAGCRPRSRPATRQVSTLRGRAASPSPRPPSRSRRGRCVRGDSPRGSTGSPWRSSAMPITLRMSTFRKLLKRAPPEQLRLQAEQKREREDLQAALARQRRRFGMSDPDRARRGGHRNRQARPGTGRAARPCRRRRPSPCRGAAAIFDAGPGVGDVRADHDDDGDAAQPVEIDLTLQGQPRSS